MRVARGKDPRGRRNTRRLVLTLFLLGTVFIGTSFFLPWYAVSGAFSTESFYPWAVSSAGTSEAPGYAVHSYQASDLPTVGTMYSQVSEATLACVILVGTAAVMLYVTRDPRRGRIMALGCVTAALILMALTVAYVAVEQPSIVCYDSIHHPLVGLGGPPSGGGNGTAATPSPQCSWGSWAPGGEWTSSGPTGPESSFVGATGPGGSEAQFFPSSWGPSYGWFLGVGSAVTLALGAILLGLEAADSSSSSQAQVGWRAFRFGRPSSLPRRRSPELGATWYGAERRRPLGGVLALAGVASLLVSLLSAWYWVTQAGVVETFGPAGVGSSTWLGWAPPSGFDASGMPYSSLLYDLGAAALVAGMTLGSGAAAVLLGRKGRNSARMGSTLLMAALLVALTAPVGVALAQPSAVCADFPLAGDSGNSSLAGDRCYWITQNVTGGYYPTPQYGSGPGTGFSGGAPPFAWAPSIGWYLPFFAIAFFTGGAAIARWPTRRPDRPKRAGRTRDTRQ